MYTTTTPGSQESKPIKTYNEKQEKDISNIIAQCSTKVVDENKETVYVITDMSALTIEILEYIENLINKHD